ARRAPQPRHGNALRLGCARPAAASLHHPAQGRGARLPQGNPGRIAMPITFAAAVSHVPGMTAWAEAAPVVQKDRVYAAFDRLRRELDASTTDTLIVLTSEHWANFFLDHIGAFCIGRAESYSGPVEPWLKVAKTTMKGDPQLAAELIEAAYDGGIEPGF